ncbi:MAG: hypothetical protein HFH50_13070 [Lachnospiraceae bacterium]|jgi:hypothetical protein|nr:hypothetical protein [Lachnospiraceae bacterium]
MDEKDGVVVPMYFLVRYYREFEKRELEHSGSLFLYKNAAVLTAFPAPQAKKNGTSPDTTGQKVKMKEEKP